MTSLKIKFEIASAENSKSALSRIMESYSKQDIMSQAKQQGINWTENKHEGINWMRASMAIQKFMNTNCTNVVVTPVAKVQAQPKVVKNTVKKATVKKCVNGEFNLTRHEDDEWTGYVVEYNELNGYIYESKGKNGNPRYSVHISDGLGFYVHGSDRKLTGLEDTLFNSLEDVKTWLDTDEFKTLMNKRKNASIELYTKTYH